MEKTKLEPITNAYRLLNPGSVVLVSVGNDSTDNLFAVTWNMPVGKDPGMVAILSGKRHHSYPFIEESGEFGINIPCARTANAVLAAGSISGRDIDDKFAHCGLTRQSASSIAAPLVAEAIANLECRVSQIVDLGKSSLVIGKIIDAVASVEHFQNNHWNFDNGLELIHHLGGDRFAVSNRVIVASKPD
jgi:flavin reductase (DIM6/NTAB) family NADH-FMN oxidoreductase RutF